MARGAPDDERRLSPQLRRCYEQPPWLPLAAIAKSVRFGGWTPLDNHPDQCATFTFVLAALKSLAAEPGGVGKIPDRLLTYLVHTSQGWPPPPQTLGRLPVPPKIFEPARCTRCRSPLSR